MRIFEVKGGKYKVKISFVNDKPAGEIKNSIVRYSDKYNYNVLFLDFLFLFIFLFPFFYFFLV